MPKVMNSFFLDIPLVIKLIVFNERTLVVEKSIYVIFYYSNSLSRKDFTTLDCVKIYQVDPRRASHEEQELAEIVKELKLNDFQEPIQVDKETSYPKELSYVKDVIHQKR